MIPTACLVVSPLIVILLLYPLDTLSTITPYKTIFTNTKPSNENFSLKTNSSNSGSHNNVNNKLSYNSISTNNANINLNHKNFMDMNHTLYDKELSNFNRTKYIKKSIRITRIKRAVTKGKYKNRKKNKNRFTTASQPLSTSEASTQQIPIQPFQTSSNQFSDSNDLNSELRKAKDFENKRTESLSCRFKEVSNLTECRIHATDIYMNARVKYMTLKEKLNLIEYHLFFTNYTINPLFINSTFHHRPNIWSRASTNYGQTLLSLAFNYGILSLMTLTFGTSKQNVELADKPSGCFVRLDFEEKLSLIRNLLMKDFGAEEEDHVSQTGDEIEHMYITESARICHEIVENVKGVAQFTDCCCYRHRFTGEKKCENGSDNIWLSFLYSILSFIRYIIFFFGPLLFLSTMVGLTRDQFPYTVKLKDPLLKTVFLCKSDTEIPDNIRYQHLLDFSQKSTFPKMKESLSTAMKELDDLLKEEIEQKKENNDSDNDNKSIKSFDFNESQMELPKSLFGIPIKVALKEYELFVNYKRLVTENDINIGFWKTLTNSVFFCKLKNVGPFQACCKQNMFRYIPSCLRWSNESFPWINFWKIVGLILFALFLPFPFYLRLLILYHFELDEILSRKKLIAELGLQEKFENSLLLYYLPSHPLYIFIGVLYIIVATFCICCAKQHEDGKIKKIVIASFTDLKYLSWMDVVNLLVSNIIWPFKRFGVLGCFVVLIYWPIVIPLTLLVFIVYCLPTMFITIRMLIYSHKTFHEKRVKRSKKSYRIKKKPDNNLHHLKIENIIGRFFGTNSCFFNIEEVEDTDYYELDGRHFKDKDAFSKIKLMKQSSRISDNLDLDEIDNLNLSQQSKFRSRSLSSTIIKFDEINKPCQYLGQILASIVCLLVFYSFLIIVAECIGSLVDILVFTLMGIIVNAGKLLKYIALTIMIVVYSYDSFNNVEKKYLKLNKALFTEVKCRIKDLDKVTSLPSYLQENRAFKSQELNEQAEYEMGDDVSVKPPRHWFLNDLVLFVDNEDMPRIPKKLFKNVCEIKVAGVPGPVYRGLMLAMKGFLKIVVFIVFVFMVVLTFGSVYQMSNTNQMLAALAGGSLPFILRTFMEPDKPDIEMGTVSFKSKLDEVIKNFSQIWPMFDFSFELYKEEKEEEETEEEEVELKRRGSVKSAILSSVNRSFDNDLNNNRTSSRKNSKEEKIHKETNITFKIDDVDAKNEITKKDTNNTDIIEKIQENLNQNKTNKNENDTNQNKKIIKKKLIKEPPKTILKEKVKKKSSVLKSPPPITCPSPRICSYQPSLDYPRNFPIFYSNENIFSEYVPDIQMQEEREEEEVGNNSHRQVCPSKSNMSARVCFSEPAKSVYEQVDLLVIIPESFEETIKLNSEPIFTSPV